MDDKNKRNKKINAKNLAVGLSNHGIVDIYGSANAEYIKGYTGVDNELGIKFQKGLKQISEYKVNAEYKDKNTKQQAGFSAEIAKTSKDNARKIIEGSKERTIRTDDHKDFGLNDTVYDHINTIDGQVVAGSGSQMKFVSRPDQLIDKIALGEGGGKNDLSRYLDVTLDMPSDQVDGNYFKTQAKQLRSEAAQSRKSGDLTLQRTYFFLRTIPKSHN
jgi:hypothetical protein